MKNKLKPYFTAAIKSGVKPERNGLPSEKQIKKVFTLVAVKVNNNGKTKKRKG